MEDWLKLSKGQRSLTFNWKLLLRKEGDKVSPMRGDLFLTLDDGMQQLKRILPDQMRRGMKSVGKIQREVAGFGLLLNQVIRAVGKPGFF